MKVAPQALRPAVVARYAVSLRQVDPILAPLSVHEIGLAHMAKIAKRAGITNATRRRDLTAVSAVMRWCVSEGWIESNPAKVWDRSIIRERRDPIALPSWVAIGLAIQSAPAPLGRLLLFLLQTGMRLNEAGSLTASEAALKRSEINLTKTKTGARTVTLTDAAGGTIRGTPRHIKSAWIFWHDEGARYRNLSSRLRAIIRRTGGTFRVHDLRHRYAVDYLRARRGSIYDLQQQLGHSSVKTTEIYLKYVGGEGADDDWPHPIALPDMSYETVMRLSLGGTKRGTVATVSRRARGSKGQASN
jgi:integrase/recombinase XerD